MEYPYCWIAIFRSGNEVCTSLKNEAFKINLMITKLFGQSLTGELSRFPNLNIRYFSISKDSRVIGVCSQSF